MITREKEWQQANEVAITERQNVRGLFARLILTRDIFPNKQFTRRGDQQVTLPLIVSSKKTIIRGFVIIILGYRIS